MATTSRPLTDDMSDGLEADDITPALLMEAEFASGPVYLWTGIGNLSWNGQTWLGGGQLLNVSQVSEGEQLEATTTTVTLSAIAAEWIERALAESQTGGLGKLYLALRASSGAVVADPYVIFQGRLSVPRLSDDGKTATLAVSYDNLLVDLFRARNLRYTDQQQKTLFPGDRGMEFATAVANWTGRWGPKQA